MLMPAAGSRMAAELKDLRAKITAETHCVLEAVNRVTGQDKSEVVREILHTWALEKLRIAKITDSMLRAEGMPGIAEGAVGNRRESSGIGGKE